jgi:ribosomal protein S18 acetylase RimI-like enzyme
MGEALRAEQATTRDWRAAFRLIFEQVAAPDRDARVENALRLVRRGEFDQDGIWVVRGRGGLVGAMLCQSVAGASALIWPPQALPHPDHDRIEDSLIQGAGAWLRRGGAKLAQALLAPQDTPLALPLLRNGFTHVTSLWYLRHGLGASLDWLREESGLNYRDYSRCPQELFARTLFRTYEQTCDCPEVNGIRDVHEVLAGHAAQGKHDPRRWWLAMDGDRPVGVLLLTEIEDWEGWDLSYIGVVPEARGQGMGKELTRKALREAVQARAAQLTLAVDSRNRPAWQMYRGLGFESVDQREVYLALWHRAAKCV